MFILQAIIGVLFIILGLLTLGRQSFVMRNYSNLHLSNWFTYVIGLFQLSGGILLVIGIWVDIIALVSSGIITMMMIISSILHISKKDSMVGFFPAMIVGILTAVIFVSYV